MCFKIGKSVNVEKAEFLRQNVSKTLNKFLNVKVASILSKNQYLGLNELKNSNESKIYSFDKGCGIAILGSESAIKKIKEQLDVCISTNQFLHKYDFSIYRKQVTTNVLVEPHFSISPNIAISIFKGFLSRAYKICLKQNIQNEVKFLQIDSGKTVILPWIPKLSIILKREFCRVGIKTVFCYSDSLLNILCRNKSALHPNSYPGVYQLDCSCGASYVSKTRKKNSTRVNEHEKNIAKGNWDASGIVEHAQHCRGSIN
ncbi:uncharacterized protein LOC136092812 [Hydra vulgaris]|uniref:uncharacterized protein LOC136092812 n=1 Tax=Hydra vulgaris TaxID=6087 RepID=UPI0032EA8D0C